MPTIEISVGLDERTAEIMRRRTEQLHKPLSDFVADLITEDARRYQDELADEGYRLLSNDTSAFATATLPLAAETWPGWKPVKHG